MSLTAGIVGLPNVGKSTLFNAITKKNILAANYPFATIDPNVGVVTVPDKRVEVLENMYIPERTIPTTYEFTDIAGLVKGASNGEGLGNKFLSHIREVDAVVEVVRCFNDENIIHVDGTIDPIRDIEVINVELVLSDLEIVMSRINKIGKKAMTTKDKKDIKEIELLNKIKKAEAAAERARKQVLEAAKDVENEKKKRVELADKLKDWIFTENESAQTEQDFAFKYLFMPYYRQVISDRTLYAYTTSDQLFKTIKNQDFGIDYRWVVQNKKIPIEDSMIMLGIYKECRNQPGATEFISWFFNVDNQQKILERKEKLNLDTELFGISGGFSSIRDVTEHILPVFYTHLLTNLPPSQMLSVPQKLPARWDSYKSLVIEPYLRSVITAQPEETVMSIEDLESEWRRKVFD